MLSYNFGIILFFIFTVNYGSSNTSVSPNDYNTLALKNGWQLTNVCEKSWLKCYGQKPDEECYENMEKFCKAKAPITTSTTPAIPVTTETEEAETSLPSFVRVMHYFVYATPEKVFQTATLESCQMACLEYDSFLPCIGVEYLKSNFTCVILSLILDIRVYNGACNWYIIVRDFPSTEGLNFFESLVETNVFATNRVCPDGYLQADECKCIKVMDIHRCIDYYAPFLMPSYDVPNLECILPPRHCRKAATTPKSEL